MIDPSSTPDFLPPLRSPHSLPPGIYTIRLATQSDQSSLQALIRSFHQERSAVLNTNNQRGEWLRLGVLKWVGLGALMSWGLHALWALAKAWAVESIVLLGLGIILLMVLVNAIIDLNFFFTSSKDRQQYWVVEHKGQLIGCAELRFYKHYSMLCNVFVVSDWRGQGIGTDLVRQVTQVGSKPIYLAARRERVPFYRRLGFQLVSPKTLSPLLRRELTLTTRSDILPLVFTKSAEANSGQGFSG